MKLIPLYKHILSAAGMVADKDGYVSYEVLSKTKPATIKGKRIVLPTQEHLANPDWTDRIVFHPLSENILRGESVILEEFRSALNISLNYKIGVLALQLLVIATSIKDHAKLSPDQLEFLSRVKNADEKTLDTFEKILAAMGGKNGHSFVHIYLKRGGTIAGKRHSRVGIVSFPFVEELSKKEGDVFGVKLRVKDRETLINLIGYVFPMSATAAAHNRGSDSDIAPYLDALMKSFMGIASCINDQVTLFENVLDNAEDILIDDKWVETFENLAVMTTEIRKVPMQSGNEGAVPGTQQVVHEHAPITQPVAAVKSPLPAVLMTATPAPVSPAWQMHSYPQIPAVMHPVTQPVRTQRGLDFDSLLRSNPTLAAAAGGPVNQYNQPIGGPGQPRYQGNMQQPMNSGWNNQQPNSFAQMSYHPGCI